MDILKPGRDVERDAQPPLHIQLRSTIKRVEHSTQRTVVLESKDEILLRPVGAAAQELEQVFVLALLQRRDLALVLLATERRRISHHFDGDVLRRAEPVALNMSKRASVGDHRCWPKRLDGDRKLHGSR